MCVILYKVLRWILFFICWEKRPMEEERDNPPFWIALAALASAILARLGFGVSGNMQFLKVQGEVFTGTAAFLYKCFTTITRRGGGSQRSVLFFSIWTFIETMKLMSVDRLWRWVFVLWEVFLDSQGQTQTGDGDGLKICQIKYWLKLEIFHYGLDFSRFQTFIFYWLLFES